MVEHHNPSLREYFPGSVIGKITTMFTKPSHPRNTFIITLKMVGDRFSNFNTRGTIGGFFK